ncbi:hypothetical protein [Butyricimonas paravirosa]|uniref:hypothetical protein n=1 Tax=Butyricimonas paravirosa TaxID=1472417 RepID=UPI00210C6FF7|nr:hypothetical protein [Butyricimonas paravirosa]MCQ4872008.1 hypothetical protein [Butyricimonas paravirosa]
MQNAKDLLKYKKDLSQAITDKSNTIFFNDSILHAMLIMKELFNKASQEVEGTMRMYCGKFSLFRDKTKIKILNEKNNCSLDYLSDEEQIEWRNLNFFNNLQETLNNFINRGKKIRINIGIRNKYFI